MSEESVEMPKYQSHKTVHALKIAQIDHQANGDALITPEEEGYLPFLVAADMVKKHEPRVGGYYVVYKDGHASYSPPKAFEEGYSRVAK